MKTSLYLLLILPVLMSCTNLKTEKTSSRFISSKNTDFTKFKMEQGDYSYGLSHIYSDISESAPYLLLHPNTSFFKSDYVKSLKYKLNSINEYQLQHWYGQDFFRNQTQLKVNFQGFMKKFDEKTFNKAKIKFYKNINFNWNKLKHDLPYPTIKVWGNLAHPPMHSTEFLLENYDLLFAPINYDKIQSKFFSPEFHLKVDNETGTELTFGNDLTLRYDNDVFKEKMRLAKKSKKLIWGAALTFTCDKSGKLFAEVLEERARAGVDVRILTEGSYIKLFNKKCAERLMKSGVKFIFANDIFKHKWFAIFHIKQWVFDAGEDDMSKYIGAIGGHNIIDADNLSRSTDFLNRDADVFVKGPATTDLLKSFISHWNYFSKKEHKISEKMSSKIAKLLIDQRSPFYKKRGRDFYIEKLSNYSTRMKGVCRYVNQSPGTTPAHVAKVLDKYLDVTESYLGIVDPIKLEAVNRRKDKYSQWFNNLTEKIQQLSSKGVKVDYITSGGHMAANELVPIFWEFIQDHLENGRFVKARLRQWSIDRLNRNYGVSLFNSIGKDFTPYKNIRVWNHISFIHSKLFYFDRIALSVGSMNLHKNATDQAYESTLICQDKKLNAQADRGYILDMANSAPFVYKEIINMDD